MSEDEKICCNCGLESDTEHDGELYCDNCFYDLFSSCDFCGKTVNQDDIVICDGDLYCESCAEDKLGQCYECGETFIQNNLHYAECVNQEYCDNCFYDLFSTCENCSETFFIDDLDDNYFCSNCRPQFEGVYEYDYYPTPLLKGEPSDKELPLYFGVEIEIECVAGETDEAKNLPNFCYAKEDDSLDNGWEITSSPMTWEWIQEHTKEWEDILSIRKRGYRSYETDTCGMHVHMSKKAFTGLHLYKFLKLFFENQQFIMKVSRRKKSNMEKWASLETDESLVYKAKHKTCRTKYTAVNLQRSDTVEIRIFRGTLHPTGFWMNLEFCKAAYDYTKIEPIKEISGEALQEYILKNWKQFPNISAFLKEA